MFELTIFMEYYLKYVLRLVLIHLEYKYQEVTACEKELTGLKR